MAEVETKIYQKLPVLGYQSFAACCGAYQITGWPFTDFLYEVDSRGGYKVNPAYTPAGHAKDQFGPGGYYLGRPMTDEDRRKIIENTLGKVPPPIQPIYSSATPPMHRPGAIINGTVAASTRARQVQTGALVVAVLTQNQRKIWGDLILEYGFIELTVGFNYANDCHLYVATIKAPKHMKATDFAKMPLWPDGFKKKVNIEHTVVHPEDKPARKSRAKPKEEAVA